MLLLPVHESAICRLGLRGFTRANNLEQVLHKAEWETLLKRVG